MKNHTIKKVIKIAGFICTAVIASTIKPMISVASGPGKRITQSLWINKASQKIVLAPALTLQRINLDKERTLEILPVSGTDQKRTEETRLLEHMFGNGDYWFKTTQSRSNYTWIRAQITANYIPSLAGVALYQNDPLLKKTHLAFLVTDPKHRAQKIGTSLIQYIIDQTGCQFIDLHSTLGACDFYRKLGFVQSGDLHKRYFIKQTAPQISEAATVQTIQTRKSS